MKKVKKGKKGIQRALSLKTFFLSPRPCEQGIEERLAFPLDRRHRLSLSTLNLSGSTSRVK